MAESTRERWIAPAAAVLAHASALRGGYLWLDHAHLEEGRAIAPPAQWHRLLLHGFAGTGYYRPLTALSLSLDALAHSPFVYHAQNLAWHGLAALLVVLVAEAFGLTRRAATIAGVLFAVHPLGSIVASAIAFRSEAMLATFLLTAVWAVRRAKPFAVAAALLAAGLTKETAFALGPLFLGALAFDARREGRGMPRRELTFGALGLAGAAAPRLAWAPSWRAPFAPLETTEIVGTRLASLWKSALAVAVPYDRHVCDAFAPRELWTPAALAGLAVAAAVLLLAWRRRGPALLLGLAILPSLQLVPVMRWWSPHYLYVALAFVAILAAESVQRLGERATMVAATAAAVLGFVSFLDARRFESDETLWRPEVAREPACLEGHFYLGEVARKAKSFQVAAKHYQAALEPESRVLAFVDRGAALQNLGAARLEEGRYPEARDAFERARAGTTEPFTRRELTHDLALVSFRAGNLERAEHLLREETERPDALPASLLLRANALDRLGRTAEADALRARMR